MGRISCNTACTFCGFSKRILDTHQLCCYIFERYLRNIVQEKNIRRKNWSRSWWIYGFRKSLILNTRTNSKPLRTNWWHRLFRCLFKWSVGESKWGSQVHPFHRITWKGHRILGIEPMLLLQLAGLLTIVFLFRHCFRHFLVEWKLSKDILNENLFKYFKTRIILHIIRYIINLS